MSLYQQDEGFKAQQKVSSAAARIKGEARIALENAMREIDKEAENIAADFDLIADPGNIDVLSGMKARGIQRRGDRSRRKIEDALARYTVAALDREITIRKHGRKAE